jgi:epoxide hydrolase-like predicted phosphatase
LTIRAVIFDIGGVLYRTEDTTLYRQWEIRLGLSDGELTETVFTHPVAQEALVGRATTEDLWRAVGSQLRLSPDELDALKEDFWAAGEWDDELLAFARSLRPRVKTGIISDAWPDARQVVRAYVNERAFDVCVFSAEEGVRKPDPEIYRRALRRLDVLPQEAVFVDDRLPNVSGARRMGMHGILFVSSDQVCKAIEAYLLDEQHSSSITSQTESGVCNE